MLVKFKTSVAGVNLHFSGGETYDLPSADANYWIREGLAELVNDKNEEQEEIRPLIVQEIKKPRTRPVNKK